MKNSLKNIKSLLIKIISFLSGLKNFNKNNYRNLLKDENKIADKSIKYGLLSLFVFFIIFMFWAFFLPIKSAVIAEGIVVLDFNRKIIQHLEGGIVEKILVKEGDFVEQNQPLILLSDIKSKSDKKTLLTKYWSIKLQKLRLISEKNDENEINIKLFLKEIGEIDEENKNEVDEIILTQKQLFEVRENKSRGEIKLLQQKLIESQNQLISLNKQKKSVVRKKSLILQELKMIKNLVAENNLSLTHKIDLQKQLSDTETKGFELSLEIDKMVQLITQNELQILNYRNEDLSKILDEIKQTEVDISALENELKKTQDIFARSEIVASVAGRIMDIKYHTIGAVVQAGAPIMTIVPQNDKLIIEAKVRPQDIDSIHNEMQARIALTAYKDKKVPKLQGKVINISADILSDEKTKESYFIARIAIDENEVAKLKNKIEISPGMPAQVFIITGSRTLVDYLISPIQDSAYKAFREE